MSLKAFKCWFFVYLCFLCWRHDGCIRLTHRTVGIPRHQAYLVKNVYANTIILYNIQPDDCHPTRSSASTLENHLNFIGIKQQFYVPWNTSMNLQSHAMNKCTLTQNINKIALELKFGIPWAPMSFHDVKILLAKVSNVHKNHEAIRLFISCI